MIYLHEHLDLPLRLEPHQTQVFQIDCAKVEAITDHNGILSRAELDRADRFHFDRDRTRFLLSRLLLRQFLEAFDIAAAADVVFEWTEHGKPLISKSHAASWFHFNLSHSGRFLVFAFSHGHAVGVDVETARPQTDIDGIVSRFFHEYELTEYLSLPETARPQAFLGAWTKKEAILKAMGCGLTDDALRNVIVSMSSDQPPRLINQLVEHVAGGDWQVNDITLDSRYAAALAHSSENELAVNRLIMLHNQ